MLRVMCSLMRFKSLSNEDIISAEPRIASRGACLYSFFEPGAVCNREHSLVSVSVYIVVSRYLAMTDGIAGQLNLPGNRHPILDINVFEFST